MNLLIMGAPGAGKGTHASVVARKLKLEHLSSGDLLRDAVINQNDAEIKARLDAGKLVPDELANHLVLGVVQKLTAEGKGFILDGFPRTVQQALALDELFEAKQIPLDRIVNLKVDEDVVVKRVNGRRTCPQCKKVYHVVEMPSKKGDFCEVCEGVSLVKRSDDNDEIIRQRLKVYRKNTEPILEHYADTGLVSSFDGAMSKDRITQSIIDELSKKLNS